MLNRIILAHSSGRGDEIFFIEEHLSSGLDYVGWHSDPQSFWFSRLIRGLVFGNYINLLRGSKVPDSAEQGHEQAAGPDAEDQVEIHFSEITGQHERPLHRIGILQGKDRSGPVRYPHRAAD